jgi:hypothetical protein
MVKIEIKMEMEIKMKTKTEINVFRNAKVEWQFYKGALMIGKNTN